MKQKWLSMSVAVAALIAVGVLFERDLCEGFLPENDMAIPMGLDFRGGGINEAEFNEVLDRIEALYEPEVANLRAGLIVNRLWTNATVNASATRNGRLWIINMYGGLARHPSVTKDGFALVACHEMGHHLGGAPKVGGIFALLSRWASNEGAADYYATLKCLRRYFEKDDNEKILAEEVIDPSLRKTCEATHGRRLDQLLCIRSAMAGMSVSGMFNSLSGSKNQLSFTTPDTRQVRRTEHRHPQAQCRLDTYFAGAICTVPVHEALSNRDYHPGSCTDARVFEPRSLRPRCWFKPDRKDDRSFLDTLAANEI